MNYEELSTDEMVELIIDKIGVGLPTYNYNDYRKYISTVPMNISVGDMVTGIESDNMHDTFREACLRIINWWHDEFVK